MRRITSGMEYMNIQRLFGRRDCNHHHHHHPHHDVHYQQRHHHHCHRHHRHHHSFTLYSSRCYCGVWGDCFLLRLCKRFWHKNEKRPKAVAKQRMSRPFHYGTSDLSSFPPSLPPSLPPFLPPFLFSSLAVVWIFANHRRARGAHRGGGIGGSRLSSGGMVSSYVGGIKAEGEGSDTGISWYLFFMDRNVCCYRGIYTRV